MWILTPRRVEMMMLSSIFRMAVLCWGLVHMPSGYDLRHIEYKGRPHLRLKNKLDHGEVEETRDMQLCWSAQFAV